MVIIADNFDEYLQMLIDNVYDFITEEKFPFNFKMVLDKINIGFERHDYLPEEKETYQIREEINEKIKEFLISGIDKGDLRSDLKSRKLTTF